MLSIQLSEYNDGFPADVTFIGTKADSSTVSSTVSLDTVFGFETFNLSGFTNLTSVSWTQEPEFHQFDNIVVSDSTVVPEPASILGLMLFGGLTASTARRRNRTQK